MKVPFKHQRSMVFLTRHPNWVASELLWFVLTIFAVIPSYLTGCCENKCVNSREASEWCNERCHRTRCKKFLNSADKYAGDVHPRIRSRLTYMWWLNQDLLREECSKKELQSLFAHVGLNSHCTKQPQTLFLITSMYLALQPNAKNLKKEPQNKTKKTTR